MRGELISFSSLFTNHLEVHLRRYMSPFFAEKGACSASKIRQVIITYAQEIIAIANVWQESQSPRVATQCFRYLDKFSIQNFLSICLLNKLLQLVLVRSSFNNVKLLHDWSNFDLLKLMPVEHISWMPVS